MNLNPSPQIAAPAKTTWAGSAPSSIKPLHQSGSKALSSASTGNGTAARSKRPSLRQEVLFVMRQLGECDIDDVHKYLPRAERYQIRKAMDALVRDDKIICIKPSGSRGRWKGRTPGVYGINHETAPAKIERPVVTQDIVRSALAQATPLELAWRLAA